MKRQDLINTLALLKPGLSNKDIIEQGMCFNFHKDVVVTYNDIISISAPLESGIEGAIEAEDLYKLLNKITAEDIELTRTDNEVRVKAGKIKAGLAVTEKTIPPLYPEGEWQELPAKFKEAVKFCLFSTSKDMTRPHLTCVHLQGVKVSSSDNWRITQFVMDSAMPCDFLLPADAAEHLVKYNVTHVCLDESWIHFADGETGLIFSVRVKVAKFINVDKHFEVEGKIVKLPDLSATLERARVMIEADSDKDLKIKVEMKPGVLVCHGKKNTGWIEEQIEIEYDGDAKTLLINPLFLADILSRVQEVMVGENTCLFWGENFRHVMMLAKE